MSWPSLRHSIGLDLVSVGVEIVGGWEDYTESLGVMATLVRVRVGVLGPGIAGVLGLPGPYLTPLKLTIPR